MRHFLESKMIECDCGDVGGSCGTNKYTIIVMEMIHSFVVLMSRERMLRI